MKIGSSLHRFIVPLFLLCALCVLCGDSFAQEVKEVNEKSSASSASSAVKPVPIDGELTGLLTDRNVIAALVELTEAARGPVTLRFSIAELRKMDEAKAARIAAWFKARGIPEDWQKQGWTVADGKFVPPAKPTAEAAKDAEAKKP